MNEYYLRKEQNVDIVDSVALIKVFLSLIAVVKSKPLNVYFNRPSSFFLIKVF